MPIVAGSIAAGGNILGSVIGANASENAAQDAMNAEKQASKRAMMMMEPYMYGGNAAYNTLLALYGIYGGTPTGMQYNPTSMMMKNNAYRRAMGLPLIRHKDKGGFNLGKSLGLGALAGGGSGLGALGLGALGNLAGGGGGGRGRNGAGGGMDINGVYGPGGEWQDAGGYGAMAFDPRGMTPDQLREAAMQQFYAGPEYTVMQGELQKQLARQQAAAGIRNSGGGAFGQAEVASRVFGDWRNNLAQIAQGGPSAAAGQASGFANMGANRAQGLMGIGNAQAQMYGNLGNAVSGIGQNMLQQNAYNRQLQALQQMNTQIGQPMQDNGIDWSMMVS